MTGVFFFNDTATTEIYTRSLHDALPIWRAAGHGGHRARGQRVAERYRQGDVVGRIRCPVAHPPAFSGLDRKSTRLNSSHANISYAVFCLKKKQVVPRAAMVRVDT